MSYSSKSVSFSRGILDPNGPGLREIRKKYGEPMGIQSSLRNAAIVLNSLPKKKAAAVMARMESADLKSVFSAIGSLDTTSSKQIFGALEELARDAERIFDAKKQSGAETQPRSQDDLAIMSQAYRESPFAFMINASPSIVHQLLRDEHPKNIAMVMANLPAEIANEQIKILDPVLRISVVKRICQIESGDLNEQMHELAFSLKLRFQKIMGAYKKSHQGISIASRMLNLVDEELRTEVMARIGQSDPELEESLDRSFVCFEDLAKLSDADIRVILKNTDTSFWAPALKNAPVALLKKIKSNMHQRAAEVLERQVQSVGQLSRKASQTAQSQILGVYFNLSRSNLISTMPR